MESPEFKPQSHQKKITFEELEYGTVVQHVLRIGKALGLIPRSPKLLLFFNTGWPGTHSSPASVSRHANKSGF
jgi:hypothetical protein